MLKCFRPQQFLIFTIKPKKIIKNGFGPINFCSLPSGILKMEKMSRPSSSVPSKTFFLFKRFLKFSILTSKTKLIANYCSFTQIVSRKLCVFQYERNWTTSSKFKIKYDESNIFTVNLILSFPNPKKFQNQNLLVQNRGESVLRF